MTPTDHDTISKEELGDLQAEEIPIPVVILDASSPDELIRSTMAALAEAPVLGLDTETKPSFEKGGAHPVSLLQLSDHRQAVLIRLLTFSPEEKAERLAPVARLLRSDSTLLVGVSIHDDALALRRDHDLECHRVLELQLVAKAAGLKVFSLSKLYALLYHKRISKSQRLSNWEIETLSQAQTKYAALDAYAGLRIYEGLTDYITPEMIEAKVAPGQRKASRVKKDPKGRKRHRRLKAKRRSAKESKIISSRPTTE